MGEIHAGNFCTAVVPKQTDGKKNKWKEWKSNLIIPNQTSRLQLSHTHNTDNWNKQIPHHKRNRLRKN